MSIRRRYSREPDFANLIHFVEDEATLMKDPLFSKEALSEYIDKREVSVKRKKKDICHNFKWKDIQIVKFFSIVSKGSWLRQMWRFQEEIIEDKSKFLAKNKLCYGCYMSISFDHNARSCKQRRVFTIFKKNTLQVFMVTNTQGKANWEIAVPVTMRIPWLVQQLKWSQELWACASNLLKWNMFTLERKFKHMQ